MSTSNNSDLPPRDPMTGRFLQAPPPAQFGANRGQSSGGLIKNADTGHVVGPDGTGGQIVHK